RTLKTEHQHDTRNSRRDRQSTLGVAKEREHFVPNDPHDVLRRRQTPEDLFADRFGAHAVDKRLDDPEIDVGLEQGETDLAERRVDGGLAQTRLASKRLEDVLQAVAQGLEHDDCCPKRLKGKRLWYTTGAEGDKQDARPRGFRSP